MVNPLKIFLVFFSVIFMLSGIILIFPGGNIPLGGGFSIKFFTSKVFLEPEKRPDKVDISKIIDRVEVAQIVEDKIELPIIEVNISVAPPELIIIGQGIEFPEGDPNALQYFFEGLDSVKSFKKQIRILHYGDSQIEGDRITATLRNRFQANKYFDGCGIGIVPVKENAPGRGTLVQSSSDNWIRFSSFQKNKFKIKNIAYGLMGNFFRFTPPTDTIVDGQELVFGVPKDTAHIQKGKIDFQKLPVPEKIPVQQRNLLPDSLKETVPDTALTELIVSMDSFPGIRQKNDSLRKPIVMNGDHSAWLNLTRSHWKNNKSQQVENFKLLYNNINEPVQINITINDKHTIIDTLLPTNNFTYKQWPLSYPYQKISFEFQGKESPDIYGVALDCDSGVAVDNIPMRGASIMNFTRMNRNNLSNMIHKMDARLIILQFGVNVVPNVGEDYTYYENMVYRQLMAIKKSTPEISVLVVGVSDMSRKDGTKYASYPNVEKIRNAQKKAAFRAGCAFWDLYEAMGGQNSMVSWVQNSPSYAQLDYTHFNHRGADIVGKMIYDALIQEYNAYKKNL